MSSPTTITPATGAPERPRAGGLLDYFKSHPQGFWFFFWGEFAERCSYYGMRAILALYMTDRLGFSQANSGTFMSVFIAGCYFLPLLGGFLADKYFGKYWTIVGFSVPYVVGQCLVGIENEAFLIFSLALLAMGSGVIKPNISTLMGLTYTQQRPGDDTLRREAFSMFYFAINVGAALSQLTLPKVRDIYGYQAAFLVPAVFMALALAIFALGKRYYGIERIGEAATLSPEEKAQRWVVLGQIVGLFVLVMFFWAIFDQSTSTWIFFADTFIDCRVFGFAVAPDQIQSLNPVFILVFLPLITYLWRVLDQRGYPILPTTKMVIGFLLTAGCMGVMAIGGFLTGPSESGTRLILKEGSAILPACRVVFNESIVDLRGARAVLETEGDNKGKITLEGGELAAGASPTRWADAEAQLPAQHVAVDKAKNRVTVLRGKIFIHDGTVRFAEGEEVVIKGGEVKSVGPLTVRFTETGEAVIKGGAAESIDGGLRVRVTEGGEVVIKGTVESLTGGLTLSDGKVLRGEKILLQPGKYAAIENKVSIWWNALAFLVITIAEILISVTGLQLAFDAAPKSMTGFVTGCWLAAVGMGNLVLNVPFTQIYPRMHPGTYFAFLTGTMLVVTVAFTFMAGRFNRATAVDPSTAAGGPLGGAGAQGAADPA